MRNPEAAFEGGKWGDRPRPRSFDKKKHHCPQTGKKIMKKLNSCAKSRKLI